jgi:hypothetical protein
MSLLSGSFENPNNLNCAVVDTPVVSLSSTLKRRLAEFPAVYSMS